MAYRVYKAPPPTRGWTPVAWVVGRDGGGSPAYAGMDRRRADVALQRLRLPRLRGDGPVGVKDYKTEAEAPPPTRGWTRLTAGTWGVGIGSPAYAGMDP